MGIDQVKCSLIPLVGIKGKGELPSLKEIWGLYVNVIYMEQQIDEKGDIALSVAGTILHPGKTWIS